MVNKVLREVLYVEDDSADVELFRAAARDIGWEELCIHVVEDGEKALAYANGDAGHTMVHHQPQIILLDLSLPKANGKEILKAIKCNNRLRHIPVLVVTTSNLDRDFSELRTLGAARCFTKPTGYESIKSMLKEIRTYPLNEERASADLKNTGAHG